LTELSIHAEKYGKEEIIQMEKEVTIAEDPEVVFLREEEK
jgi:hypothetical protein